MGFLRSLRHWIGSITVSTIVWTTFKVVAVLAVLVAVLFFAAGHYPYSQIPPLEPVDEQVFLDQGWGAGLETAPRQTYYYTAQGAGLKDMRYSWFVNLELPWGKSRFKDPNHLRRYGFIVDPQTQKNPDELPVGFTKHFDRQLNEELLDITCAACHTGQLNTTRNGRTTAIRIDGGQAMHAFTASNAGHFLPTMVSSMASTYLNPFKFNRFALRVLGEQYQDGYWTLHGQLRQVLMTFGRMVFVEKWHDLAPTEEGFGRTDALARIANTAFGDNLSASNYAIGDAPVSYPPVWNIWKFDWVQYNASVSQPMARNIGEALGVGAKYALINRYGQPLPPDQRFRSSALIENLDTIERALWQLKPPEWPEQYLGAVDRQKAERGKALFNQHCVTCHGPHIAPPAVKARLAPLKRDTEPEWLMNIVCVDDIGTDPNTATNFVNAYVDLTRTGMTADDVRRVARATLEKNKARDATYLAEEIARVKQQMAPPGRGTVVPTSANDAQQQVDELQKRLDGLDADLEGQLSQIDPRRISVGAALSYVGTMMRETAYNDAHYAEARQAELDGFATLDMPQVVAGYKPRPLAGIWATPPYLHNGSVPTIYDLLSPADDRPKTFLVASREFDPLRLGLVRTTGKGFEFDTSEPGNSNRGHEFNNGYVAWTKGSPPRRGLIGPLLTDDERLAIIEHLKVRDDDRDGPQEPHQPDWPDCGRPVSAPQARLQR